MAPQLPRLPDLSMLGLLQAEDRATLGSDLSAVVAPYGTLWAHIAQRVLLLDAGGLMR